MASMPDFADAESGSRPANRTEANPNPEANPERRDRRRFIGPNLPRAISSRNACPIYFTSQEECFKKCLSNLLPTTRKCVEMVAMSPLLKGLACHLLVAGSETDAIVESVDWAK